MEDYTRRQCTLCSANAEQMLTTTWTEHIAQRGWLSGAVASALIICSTANVMLPPVGTMNFPNLQLQFELPVLVGEGDPQAAVPEHFWFPEDGAVIGAGPSGETVIVANTRFTQDGTPSPPGLPHMTETMVSWDGGRTYSHLWFDNPVTGTPTRRAGGVLRVPGARCLIEADNRSFSCYTKTYAVCSTASDGRSVPSQTCANGMPNTNLVCNTGAIPTWCQDLGQALVANASECCSLCAQNRSSGGLCTSWVFRAETSQCDLKVGQGNVTASADTSGRLEPVNPPAVTVCANTSVAADVQFTGFPFNVARFTYASKVVTVDPEHFVQLRAYSHKMNEIGGADQSLSAFGSSDGGVSWQFLAVVASRNATVIAKKWEGPGENDLVRLHDGRLLGIFRVDSCHPYWKAYSSDLGKTWSAPETMPFGSARPKMLALEDGRVLLTGGRPGLFMWVGDATGVQWSAINLALVHNEMVANFPAWQYSADFINASAANQFVQGSTSYTSLLDLGDGVALVQYDRLAHGWSEPPGPWGDRDRTFSMRFRYM